jgi:hypothetical protein
MHDKNHATSIDHINVMEIIKDLDKADTIISTLIKCALNDQDDNSFTIPHEDVTVLLNMALESLRKSQDNVSKY